MAIAMDNSSLLLCRVGPVLCCAPALPIISIIPPPELTRPPGSDSAKPGIFKHGGHIVSSLDLRFKFGVDEQHWVKPGKMIVTEIDPGHIGFWVDEIIDVIGFPDSGWGPLPTHLPRGIFTRTLVLKDRIFLFAEFGLLYKIPDSGYLRVYIEKLLEEQQRSKTPVTHDKTIKTEKQPTLASTKKASGTTTTISHTREKTARVMPGSRSVDSRSKSSVVENRATELTNDRHSSQRYEQNQPVRPTNNIARHQAADKTNSSLPQHPKTKLPVEDKPSPPSLDKQSSRAAVQHIQTPETPAPATAAFQSTKPAATQQTQNKASLTDRSVTKESPPVTETNEYQTGKKASPAPKPATKAHQKNNLPDAKTESEGIIPGLLFILLMIGFFAGLYWYFSRDITQPVVSIESPGPVTQTDKESYQPAPTKPTQESIVIERTQPIIIEQTEPAIKEPVVSIESPGPVTQTDKESYQPAPTKPTQESIVIERTQPIIIEQTEPAIKEDATVTTVESTTPPTATVTPATIAESEVFKADIEKDEAGITIFIDAPEGEEVFKLDTESGTETKTTSNTVLSQSTDESELQSPTIDDQSQTQPPAQKDSASKDTQATETKTERQTKPRITTREIIHIVEKGDTLWHIAIRYVNDPYKYPELARLSNIENPDLIYPGNRVRIIKRTKPAKPAGQ
jgi:chemotaxis signal transduction protein